MSLIRNLAGLGLRRRSRPLARRIRELYRVEPLEQRILLSADPALSAAQAVYLRDPQELEAAQEIEAFEQIAALGDSTQATRLDQTQVDVDPQVAEEFDVAASAFQNPSEIQAGYLDAAVESRQLFVTDADLGSLGDAVQVDPESGLVIIGSAAGNDHVFLGVDADGNSVPLRLEHDLLIHTPNIGGHVTIGDGFSARSLEILGSGSTTELEGDQSFDTSYTANDKVLVTGAASVTTESGSITLGSSSSAFGLGADPESTASENTLALDSAANVSIFSVVGRSDLIGGQDFEPLDGLEITAAGDVVFTREVEVDGDLVITAGGNVTFNSTLSLTGGGSLTIEAANGITFEQGVTLSGIGAGDVGGNVHLKTNNLTLSGGEGSFQAAGAGSGALFTLLPYDNDRDMRVGAPTTESALNLSIGEISTILTGSFAGFVFGHQDGSTGRPQAGLDYEIRIGAREGSDQITFETDVQAFARSILIADFSSQDRRLAVNGSLHLAALDDIVIRNTTHATSVSLFSDDGMIRQENSDQTPTSEPLRANSVVVDAARGVHLPWLETSTLTVDNRNAGGVLAHVLQDRSAGLDSALSTDSINGDLEIERVRNQHADGDGGAIELSVAAGALRVLEGGNGVRQDGRGGVSLSASVGGSDAELAGVLQIDMAVFTTHEDAETISLQGEMDVRVGARVEHEEAVALIEVLAQLGTIVQSAPIETAGRVVLSAHGDIELFHVRGLDSIEISSSHGAILNARGEGELNLESDGAVVLAAATGVGSAGQVLELQAPRLSVDNDGSGGVWIHHDRAGGLEVFGDGIRTAGDDGSVVLVVAQGTLHFSADVSLQGSLAHLYLETLGGDVVLAEGVTVETASGDVSVDAQGSITLNKNAALTAEGSERSLDLVAGASVLMHAGAALATQGGHQRVVAQNDLRVARLTSGDETRGHVSLRSEDGDIERVGHEDDLIRVADLRLQAAAAIGGGNEAERLRVDASRLAATAAAGGVFIEALGGLKVAEIEAVTINRVQAADATTEDAGQDDDALAGLQATNGAIVLRAGREDAGDLEIGAAVLAGNSGPVRLQAVQGDLLLAAKVSADAGSLDLRASGLLHQQVERDGDDILQSGSLEVAGSHDINVEADAVTMDAGAEAHAVDGNIRYAVSGALQLGALSTDGHISLSAADIQVADAEADVHLTGADLALRVTGIEADEGAGSAEAHLLTDIDRIAAHVAGARGLYLTQVAAGGALTATALGAIEVDLVARDGSVSEVTDDAALEQLQVGGALVLRTEDGTLTLSDSLLPEDESAQAQAAGKVLLQAGGADSDLVLGASLASSGGHVSLEAGRDLHQDADIVASQSAADIFLRAGADADADDGAGAITMGAEVTTRTSGGVIWYEARTDVVLGALDTGANDAEPGHVAVIAEEGDITAADLDGQANILADSLWLSAGNALGQAGAEIVLQADTLAAEADAGGMFLKSLASTTVDEVDIEARRVTADASTEARDASALGLLAEAGGKLVLTVTGNLTLNGDLPDPGLFYAVSALGSGNLLLDVSETLTVNTGVRSGVGHLTVKAGSLHQNPDGWLAASDAGTLMVDVATSHTMADGAHLMTANGNILLQIGGSLHLSHLATDADVRIEAQAVYAVGGGYGNVRADVLALDVEGDVGTGTDPLRLRLSELAADVKGDLFLRQVAQGGDLTVQAVAAINVQRVGADGAAELTDDTGLGYLHAGGKLVLRTTDGDLTFADSLQGDADATAVQAGDNILLAARGEGSNLRMDADLLSKAGHVSLHADTDLTQNANITLEGAGATLEALAERGSISMDAAAGILTTGGSMRLEAGDGITLGLLDTTHEGAERADVALLAQGGSILDATESAAINVRAAQLWLDATAGAGTPGAALDLDVEVLAARAGAGGLFLTQAGSLQVDAVDVAVKRVGDEGELASGALAVAGEDLRTFDDGVLVLRVTAGDLRLRGGSDLYAVAAEGAGNLLLETLGSGDIRLEGQVDGGQGQVSLRAADDLRVTAPPTVFDYATSDASLAALADQLGLVLDAGLETAPQPLQITTAGQQLLGADQLEDVEVAGVAAESMGSTVSLLLEDASGNESRLIEDVEVSDGLWSVAGIKLSDFSDGPVMVTVSGAESAQLTRELFVIDTTAPAPIRVMQPAALDAAADDALYQGPATLYFSVEFDEALDVDVAGGAGPILNLTRDPGTGNQADVQAVFDAARSSSSVLVFAHELADGSTVDRGFEIGSMELNGALLTDAAGNVVEGESGEVALPAAEAPRDVVVTTPSATLAADDLDAVLLEGTSTATDGTELQLVLAQGDQSVEITVTVSNGQWQTSTLDLGDFEDGAVDLALTGPDLDEAFPDFFEIDTAEPTSEVLSVELPPMAAFDRGTDLYAVIRLAEPLDLDGLSVPDLELLVNEADLFETSLTASFDPARSNGTTLVFGFTEPDGYRYSLPDDFVELVTAGDGGMELHAGGRIAMDALASVQTAGGHIRLHAEGADGVTLGMLDARSAADRAGNTTDEQADWGQVSVLATSGDIARAALTEGLQVMASDLRLQADGAIGAAGEAGRLQVEALRLNARAGADLFLDGASSLEIDRFSVAFQQVQANGGFEGSEDAALADGLWAGGDLLVRADAHLSSSVEGSIEAGSQLRLQAGDDGNLSLEGSVLSTGGNISLLAGADIVLASQLDTEGAGRTVDVLAGADLTMTEAAVITTAQGNVRLQAESGAALTHRIDADNAVVAVLAGAGIADRSGDSFVQAEQLLLGAGMAVGTGSNAFNTRVDRVAVQAGEGIFLQEADGLMVDAVELNIERVQLDGAMEALPTEQLEDVRTAEGALVITVASGDLVLNGSGDEEAPATALLAEGDGPVRLDVQEGALTLNAIVDAGAGHVSLLAAETLTQNVVMDGDTIVATGDVHTRDKGTVDIDVGSLQMAADTVISAGEGNVRVLAVGAISLGSIETDGDLSISGSRISDGAAGEQVNLTGGQLRLVATGDQGADGLGTADHHLQLAVSRLAAVAAEAGGGIFLRQVSAGGELEVGSLDAINSHRVTLEGTAGDGDLTADAAENRLQSGAALVLHVADGRLTLRDDIGESASDRQVYAADNIRLSTGQSDGDLDMAAGVFSSGGSINLAAAASLTQSALLETGMAGATIEVVAGGDITMSGDAATRTHDGNVRYSAPFEGSPQNQVLTLTSIAAGDASISLRAGYILRGAEGVNIESTQLRLLAERGIGSDGNTVDALHIDVAQVSAHARAAGIFLHGEGELTVARVDAISVDLVDETGASTEQRTDAAQEEVRALSNGAVVLSAESLLVTRGDGAAGVNTVGSGRVLLEARSGDLQIAAEVRGGGGSVTLVAGQDVVIDQGAGGLVTTTSGQASILVDGARDVRMTGSSSASALDASSSNGNVVVDAGRDIELSRIRAGTGYVALTADSGSITRVAGWQDSLLNVRASRLMLDAGQGVGSEAAEIRIGVGRLAAHADSDGLHLRQADETVNNHNAPSLVVDTVSVAATRVDAQAAAGATVERMRSDLSTQDDGVIRLSSVTSITLNDGDSSGHAVTAAGEGLVRLQSDFSITLNGAVDAGSGDLRVLAANRVVQAQGADWTTAGGDILVRTTSSSQGTIELNADVGTGDDGDLTLEAARHLLINDVSFDVGGDLGLESVGDTTLDGIFAIDGTSELEVGGDLAITGTYSSLGNVQLDVTGETAIHGTFTVGDHDNSDSTFTLTGEGAITLGSEAEDIILDVAGDATFKGDDSMTVTGEVRIGGRLDLTSGAELELEGGLDVGGAATLIAADTLLVNGGLTIGSELSLEAGGDLGVMGVVTADAAASLTAAEGLEIQGTLTSGGGLSLDAGGLLDLAATTVSAGTLTATAGTLEQSESIQVTAGDLLVTVAGNVNLLDRIEIAGGGRAFLDAGQALALGSDVLLDGGTGHVTLRSGADMTLAGALVTAGEGTIRLLAGGDLLMQAGAQVDASGVEGTLGMVAAGSVQLASASAATVAIEAEQGGISGLEQAQPHVIADAVWLQANGHVGNEAQTLDLAASALSVAADEGDVYLQLAGGATLTGVTVGGREVAADGSLSDWERTRDLAVLTAADGDVRIEADGLLTLAADGDLAGTGAFWLQGQGSLEMMADAQLRTYQGAVTLDLVDEVVLGSIETEAAVDIYTEQGFVRGAAGSGLNVSAEVLRIESPWDALAEPVQLGDGLMRIAGADTRFDVATLELIAASSIALAGLDEGPLELGAAGLRVQADQLTFERSATAAWFDLDVRDELVLGGTLTAETAEGIRFADNDFSVRTEVSDDTDFDGVDIVTNRLDIATVQNLSSPDETLRLRPVGADGRIVVSDTDPGDGSLYLNPAELAGLNVAGLVLGSEAGSHDITVGGAALTEFGVPVRIEAPAAGGTVTLQGEVRGVVLDVRAEQTVIADAARVELDESGHFQTAVRAEGMVSLEATDLNFEQPLEVDGDLEVEASGRVTFSGPVEIRNGGNLRISNAAEVIFADGVDVSQGDLRLQGVATVTFSDQLARGSGGAVTISGADGISLSTSSPAVLLLEGGNPVLTAATSGSIDLGEHRLQVRDAGQLELSDPVVASGGDPIDIDADGVTVRMLADVTGSSAGVSVTAGQLEMDPASEVSASGGAVALRTDGLLGVARILAEQVVLQSLGGGDSVVSTLSSDQTNVQASELIFRGYGPQAGSSGALRVAASLIEVLPPQGVVLQETSLTGQVEYSALYRGQLYLQLVTVDREVERRTERTDSDGDGWRDQRLTSGVGMGLYGSGALQAWAGIDAGMRSGSGSAGLEGSSLTVTDDEQDAPLPGSFAGLDQAYAVGDPSLQPLSTGELAGLDGFDYWVESSHL